MGAWSFSDRLSGPDRLDVIHRPKGKTIGPPNVIPIDGPNVVKRDGRLDPGRFKNDTSSIRVPIGQSRTVAFVGPIDGRIRDDPNVFPDRIIRMSGPFHRMPNV